MYARELNSTCRTYWWGWTVWKDWVVASWSTSDAFTFVGVCCHRGCAQLGFLVALFGFMPYQFVVFLAPLVLPRSAWKREKGNYGICDLGYIVYKSHAVSAFRHAHARALNLDLLFNLLPIYCSSHLWIWLLSGHFFCRTKTTHSHKTSPQILNRS